MINKLFKSHSFLISVQFVTLLAFTLLVYGAIGITTSDKDFAIILRNTNISNLIIWSYWWPLIIVTAILFGRFWCTICPMELVTSLFGRIGMRKKPGGLLKSGWVITLFYAIILIIGIHTLAIHRIPQYMAFYMLILLAVAVIAGLVWEKRTFCTHICPIGHLLGLYAMLSSKELRVKDQNVCKNCKTKDCISTANSYKFTGRSCTSELFPPKIADNRDCILCGQCHKSCTKDNIIIKKRKLAADLFTNVKLSWAEIAFFMLVSGFVIYEVLSEWKVTKKLVMATPDWVNHSLHTSGNLTGTVKAIVLFIILPGIFYLLFAALKRAVSSESWKSAITQLVLAILPVTASMHLLKALLKTTSRIPYWDFVFSDPAGVTTAGMLMDNPGLLDKSSLLFLSPYIGIIAVLLSLGGLILSLLIIKKRHAVNTLSKAISVGAVILYFSMFFVTIVAWRF